MTSWLPIKSAPITGVFSEGIDGDEFEHGPDILLSDGKEAVVGFNEYGNWFIKDAGEFFPTHWLPIPPLPGEGHE